VEYQKKKCLLLKKIMSKGFEYALSGLPLHTKEAKWKTNSLPLPPFPTWPTTSLLPAVRIQNPNPNTSMTLRQRPQPNASALCRRKIIAKIPSILAKILSVLAKIQWDKGAEATASNRERDDGKAQRGQREVFEALARKQYRSLNVLCTNGFRDFMAGP
jgi:hypothetical protein